MPFTYIPQIILPSVYSMVGSDMIANLEERECNHKVKITNVPTGSIIIKTDKFPEIKEFLSNNNGIRKRADYAIISEINTRKVILVIELKCTSNSATMDEVVDQLKGSTCILNYIEKIGEYFFKKNRMLNGFEKRFAVIRKSFPQKKGTGFKKEEKRNTTPDNPTLITGMTNIPFKSLIN